MYKHRRTAKHTRIERKMKAEERKKRRMNEEETGIIDNKKNQVDLNVDSEIEDSLESFD